MKNKKYYLISLIMDIAIIAVSFLFMVWLKPGSRTHYLPAYIRPFIGFSLLWVTVSIITGKYYHVQEKLVTTLKTSLLSNFYITTIVLISIFVFQRLEYSRTIVIGTIILATILELSYQILAAAYYKEKSFDEDIASKLSNKPLDVTKKRKRIEKIVTFSIIEDKDQTASDMLKNRHLHKFPNLYTFIIKSVDLNRIDKQQAKVINSQTLFNIENYETETQQLFINLHKLNDIKRINQYMIKVNENLKYGGYYVGSCRTLLDEFDKTFDRFPKVIAVPMFGIKFLFRRVVPKLPIFKQLYFIMTNGAGRHISKAEILGRLYYCGFRVEDVQEMDGRLHFVAKKVAEPSKDLAPSYGPLIKLQRVGLRGEEIKIFKLRTMHPYSEYLQEYVYDTCGGTIDGDGFQNDFRITGWGKIFRKLWLDELPMLINLFRGQVKIVGVRPLSFHKFSLYESDVQDLRVKTKPGLVPPFYVDLPTNLEELQDSERKYVNSYLEKPISTDMKYFILAFWNIVFKRARSK